MAVHDIPTGALVVRAHNGHPFFEGKWRDSAHRQVKRRLGPAWLEPSPSGGWRRRKGRLSDGFLDERRAHVVLAAKITEHEEELAQEPLDGEATFDTAARSWLDHLEHELRAKESTLADYRLMLTPRRPVKRGSGRTSSRILRAFGDRRLASISTADVARFLSLLDAEGISARTVNKHRQVLHAIFAFAARSDTFGLRANPAAGTEKRREAGPRPVDTFTHEDVIAIARAAREGSHRGAPRVGAGEDTLREWARINVQDAALFIVAAHTGLRRGELLALRWQDVSFIEARLTVERAVSGCTIAPTTKSGRFRMVPLADQAVLELEGLSRRDRFTERTDLVFCRADGCPLDGSALRKRFVRAQKAAEVRPRRFHDLRHTFGSLAVRAFDPVAVQSMMGHASLRTTERYLHARPRTGDAARLTAVFAQEDEHGKRPLARDQR